MPSLTLATHNLHWGLSYPERRPFDVIAACRDLDADVLVLQEAWRADGSRGAAAEVGDALGYEVTEVSLGRALMARRPRLLRTARDGDGDGDWCLALLARVPIRAVETMRLPRLRLDPAHRAVVVAHLDVDGWPLTVGATHLPHLEHGSPLLAKPLRAVLPTADAPAVLAGDLNMWGWCAELMVPRWRRLVRGRTWPATRPHSQIDHVLGTSAVAASDGRVMRVGASDHLALRVTLTPA